MRAIRQRIHRRPELAYKEFETSAFVREVLSELQIPFHHPIADTGVVAWMGRGPRSVALRADMDALPIQEAVESPFRSEIGGRMHACGHDGHVAMLLGAARLLKAREAVLNGTVRLLFQPAEEGGAGALRMCNEGALRAGPSDLAPSEAVFGLHTWPDLPVGLVGSVAGPLMAASGRFVATIRGRGGHAAMPHLAVDPVPAAASAVLALQTLVARRTSPFESAVVSVTLLEAGTGSGLNVIPEQARLGGTVRALSADAHAALLLQVRETIEAAAAAHNCSAEFSVPSTPYPPLVNDPAAFAALRHAAHALASTSNSEAPTAGPPAAWRELAHGTMAAEDFAFYGGVARSAFAFLGQGRGGGDLHSPSFTFNDAVLPLGAALHASLAIHWLAQGDGQLPQ
eukprot:tig00000692_g3256.t1